MFADRLMCARWAKVTGGNDEMRGRFVGEEGGEECIKGERRKKKRYNRSFGVVIY